MTKEYTDKQRAFVAALFHKDVNGCYAKATALAGYSDGTDPSAVARSVEDLILEESQKYLRRETPKAVTKLVGMLNDTPPNADKIMKVIDGVLDRAGLVKRDALDITVQAPTGIVILPAKKDE
jgi:hypothetical protein